MRSVITLTLICVGLAQMQPAFADTLRCGASLVEPGDDAAYVLERCGEPNQDPRLGSARGTYADLYPYVVLRADRWRYHRGRGKFPVVLVIGDDGRVQAIHYEKHRD